MSHPDAIPPTQRIVAPGPSTFPCALQVIATATDATHATVYLHGELDVATADLLTAVLDGELADGRRFIRLDLSRLFFLDCAGLGALVLAHNRLLAARGTLALAGVGARIARILALTHLDEALLVADQSGAPRLSRCPTATPPGVGPVTDASSERQARTLPWTTTRPSSRAADPSFR
jgi:anti-sigma B factor antagonist